MRVTPALPVAFTLLSCPFSSSSFMKPKLLWPIQFVGNYGSWPSLNP